jgi:hypothetical protein
MIVPGTRLVRDGPGWAPVWHQKHCACVIKLHIPYSFWLCALSCLGWRLTRRRPPPARQLGAHRAA